MEAFFIIFPGAVIMVALVMALEALLTAEISSLLGKYSWACDVTDATAKSEKSNFFI
jgi:hypothetical protein